MRIKKILSQNRRDFTAIYICEHCGAEHTASGYDDRHFHQAVIPKMVCKVKECGKRAQKNYKPLATKYDDGVTI